MEPAKRLFAFFFFILACGDVISQDKESLKCWLRNKRLEWRDFKGSIPSHEQNSLTGAQCASKVHVFPSKKSGYKAKAIFNENKSWTRDTTKYGLKHEQLHFDIAELYARKLRKAIKEIHDKQGSDETLYLTIMRILSEMNSKEEDYDTETVHGLIKKLQMEWETKICSELESLKKYESTLNDCQANDNE